MSLAGEEARIEALHELTLLDTMPEAAFDDLALLASTILGAPMALVNLVDRDRQWCKAALGLERSEIPRGDSICAHAILSDDVFVVPDTKDDPRFAENPFVKSEPRVRFYAGAPLRTPEGYAVGTLCVMDRVPRVLTPAQLSALRALGRQVEAQLALRASVRRLEDAARVKRRYDLLSASTRDAILFVGPHGKIVDANRAALAMYGYDLDTIRELRIHDLRAPEDRPSTEGRLAEARERGVLFEAKHLRSDGGTFPVEVSAQRAGGAGEDFVVSVVRDITERRAGEAALRLRERAIAASPSAIVIADAARADMPVTYVNPAFERMTGYTLGETVGRNCRFLQGHDRDQPALAEVRAALAEERECSVILKNYRKDGTPFSVELNLAPVHDERGTLTNFVAVQTDVTARLAAEEDRAALAELRAQQNATLEKELARRADQLVRADRLATLGTLAGGVGHELNNITSVLLMTKTLVRERAEQGLPPEAEDLEALDRATEHVRLHGSQLLALGRPGPDRAERLDLREVIEATLTMLHSVGRTRPVKVETVLPAHSVPVTVNRTRMNR